MQENSLQQDNPVPTTPVISPSVNNEVSNQNNFLVILLSILLLLSVSIAGFFAYQTQILVKELTNLKSSPTSIAQESTESAIEPVSVGSVVPDPTASWKTYNDERNGYLFKYPSTWKIVDLGTGSKYKDIYNTGYLLYKSDPTVECGGSVGAGGGGPCENSASIQFSVGNITSPIEDFDQSYWGRGFIIKNKTDTLIDGVPVVMAYTNDKIPEATIFKVSAKKQVYVTTEFFEDKSKSDSLYNKDTVNEINQILSTIKFIE